MRRGAYGVGEDDAEQCEEQEVIAEIAETGTEWMIGSINEEPAIIENCASPGRESMRVEAPQILKMNRYFIEDDDADEVHDPEDGANKESANASMNIKNESKDLQEVSSQDIIRMIGGVNELEEDMCALQFHLTEATKMLASVSKITQAGNEVRFDDADGESFIRNKKTGRKIILALEGNVYVMKVLVHDGKVKKRCKVVIDSGAAANVMPHKWFQGIETLEKKKGVRFAAADCEEIGNYGRKGVKFETVNCENPAPTAPFRRRD